MTNLSKNSFNIIGVSFEYITNLNSFFLEHGIRNPILRWFLPNNIVFLYSVKLCEIKLHQLRKFSKLLSKYFNAMYYGYQFQGCVIVYTLNYAFLQSIINIFSLAHSQSHDTKKREHVCLPGKRIFPAVKLRPQTPPVLP